jgi:hypothetical protein
MVATSLLVQQEPVVEVRGPPGGPAVENPLTCEPRLSQSEVVTIRISVDCLAGRSLLATGFTLTVRPLSVEGDVDRGATVQAWRTHGDSSEIIIPRISAAVPVGECTSTSPVSRQVGESSTVCNALEVKHTGAEPGKLPRRNMRKGNHPANIEEGKRRGGEAIVRGCRWQSCFDRLSARCSPRV